MENVNTAKNRVNRFSIMLSPVIWLRWDTGLRFACAKALKSLRTFAILPGDGFRLRADTPPHRLFASRLKTRGELDGCLRSQPIGARQIVEDSDPGSFACQDGGWRFWTLSGKRILP